MRSILFNILIVAIATPLSGCANLGDPGPGMTVGFNACINGKVDLIRSTSSGGAVFPNPGAFGGQICKKNPLYQGKFMGASPDGRNLPEWVEFEWQVWPYPYEERPDNANPVALQAWRDRVHLLARTLPRKIERVPVRSRIPQEIVNQVIESNRTTPEGKLPEKSLWVFFIWHEDGIKFRWKLDGCCGDIASGGDQLPAYPQRSGADKE
jgi:hypothetical protein